MGDFPRRADGQAGSAVGAAALSTSGSSSFGVGRTSMVEHEYFCIGCQQRHFAEVWYFRHAASRKEYLCLERYLELPPDELGGWTLLG